MKILVLNYEYPPIGGGAAYVTQELARAYLEKGHEVTVVTMGFENLPKTETQENLNIYRLNCFRSKSEICYPHELLSFVVSARIFLDSFLEKNPHDFCHCHFLVPSGLIARWAKKKFGLKYGVTAHGSDVPNYNPDRFTFLHRFTGPLLRRIAKDASWLVFPSNYLKTLFTSQIGTDQVSIRTLPNGINTADLTPGEKRPQLLASGRLLPRKGFHKLIEAIRKRDLGIEVNIAGDGPMLPQLRKLANASKTAIRFHGWLDNRTERYRRLLSRSLLFAHLSSHENSSIALLEAMASGCAIVAQKTPATEEMLAGVALLLDRSEPESIVRTLHQLISNPQLMEDLGAKARERAVNRYSWSVISEDYLELIESSSTGSIPINSK